MFFKMWWFHGKVTVSLGIIHKTILYTQKTVTLVNNNNL